MSNSPEQYVERLTEISGKKFALLESMHAFTRAQSDAIADDSITRLEELITEKQRIIDEIDKLDTEFNVYFLRLKQTLKISSLSEMDGKSVSGVSELQQSIGNITGLIKDISMVEKQNNLKMKQVMSGYEDELRKMSQGKQMTSGYSQNHIIQSPSYYIDKKK